MVGGHEVNDESDGSRQAIKVSEKELASPEWTRGMFDAKGKFNQELRQAGVLLAAAGLKPSSSAKRVAFDGSSRTVIDGPFAETKELVAGYWIWEVMDMEEAISWAKRSPNPMPVPSELEIRPFYG